MASEAAGGLGESELAGRVGVPVTVDLASRIAGTASADEVLVSDALVLAVTPLEGVTFEDAGAADLKNVSQPVRLWRAEKR